MNIESLWQTDPIGLISPVMTSPLLYPVLTALGGLDGIAPIIPSEIALITAGLFSRTGTPVLLLVVLAYAAGVVLGDHLVYGLSRSVFGTRLLGRFPRIGAAVDAGGRQLERRAGWVIVVSRFVPGGRVTTNIACGTTGLPLSRFSPASAVAALAWSGYYGGLGVFGGAAFLQKPMLGLLAGLAVSSAIGGVVPLVKRLRVMRRRSLHRLESPAVVGAVGVLDDLRAGGVEELAAVHAADVVGAVAVVPQRPAVVGGAGVAPLIAEPQRVWCGSRVRVTRPARPKAVVVPRVPGRGVTRVVVPGDVLLDRVRVGRVPDLRRVPDGVPARRADPAGPQPGGAPGPPGHPDRPGLSR